MSDKTVGEMVKWSDRKLTYLKLMERPKSLLDFEEIPMLQAIRKHLTESDIAHWMDRCHELEVKLAEKPVTVSRDDIDKLLARIYGAAGEYRGNKIVEIWLTELGIKLSDNSEVGRRTSDKEGE